MALVKNLLRNNSKTTLNPPRKSRPLANLTARPLASLFMRKSHKKRPEKILIPHFRCNQDIKVPEVRLLDETGQMIGVVGIEEALQRAQNVELDLVEVSPKAVPPVCKIISYSSFRYQKEKEIKAQKLKQKVVELKGVRLSLRIGEHDLVVRQEQTQKFLAGGDKVRIEMILRGRERQYMGQARGIMEQFVKNLGDSVKIEQPFTSQEGKLSIIIFLQK